MVVSGKDPKQWNGTPCDREWFWTLCALGARRLNIIEFQITLVPFLNYIHNHAITDTNLLNKIK